MIAVIGGAQCLIKMKMGLPADPEKPADPTDEVDGAEQEGADFIQIQSGGCGFNIAKRLAAMGRKTAFFSAVGKDPLGAALIRELEEAGVDAAGVGVLPGATPAKVEMYDILGDVELSHSNHLLWEQITPDFLEERRPLLQKADLILLDGLLPQETLEYAADTYGGREDVKLFFDPATPTGGAKIRDLLERFHGVMPGRMEAEAMTGGVILSEEQLMEAGAYFDEKSVGKIIITMKGGGLYYKEGLREGILRPERVLSFAGTAGAGDVVSAAVVCGTAEGKDIEAIGKYAMEQAAAFLADLEDEKPI